MKKRIKPMPLDVEIIDPTKKAAGRCREEEEEEEEAEAQLPPSVPARYASLLVSKYAKGAGNGVSVSTPALDAQFKRQHTIAGLCGLPVARKHLKTCDHHTPPEPTDQVHPTPCENPEGIAEGDTVYLRPDSRQIIEADQRFQWKGKMLDALETGLGGEVKLLDVECCQVDFGGEGAWWLPACCLDPCQHPAGGYLLRDGSRTEDVEEGIAVLLRYDAKAVISISPYPWHPTLDRISRESTPGFVAAMYRAGRASCRVQFGGYLWSLPLTALRTAPLQPTSGVEEVSSGPSYLDAYYLACQKHKCRPNSELLRIFSSGDVDVLDLSNNYLGVKGLQCLAEVLKTNKNIEELLLPHNSLSHEGLSEVIEVLKHDRVVKRVDLSCNPLTYRTGRSLKEMIAANPVIEAILLDQTSIPQWMIHEISEQASLNQKGDTNMREEST